MVAVSSMNAVMDNIIRNILDPVFSADTDLLVLLLRTSKVVKSIMNIPSKTIQADTTLCFQYFSGLCYSISSISSIFFRIIFLETSAVMLLQCYCTTS